MPYFRSGHWICEHKGISIVKLANACHAGKVIAYFNESERKIISSSQCIKKFLFPDRTFFTLKTSNYPRIIAIHKYDINDFIVHFGNISDRYNENNLYHTNTELSGHKSSIVHEQTNLMEEDCKIDEISHEDEHYLLPFSKRFKYPLHKDIHKRYKYVYTADEIIFEPKREGHFTIRILELDPNFHDHHKCKSINIYVNKIEDSTSSKLILEDIEKCDITIYYGSQCFYCDKHPLVDTNKCREIFSKKYEQCMKYYHQYKLNYFNPEDKEYKKPLKLYTDFFIFDYNEYCQQTYPQSEIDSRKTFYEYIERLFFDISDLENISIDDFDEDEFLNNPLEYMEYLSQLLQEKYSGCDEEDIIKAYFRTITTHVDYHELHDEFFPFRKNKNNNGIQLYDDNKKSYFCRFINKFRDIAEKENIPFIYVKDFRKIMKKEGREEQRKKFKELFDTIRAKKRDKHKL